MNLRTKLALLAMALFAVSFFLPADGNMSGMECLSACFGVFTRFSENHDLRFWPWLYYSGFVLANILFAALSGALLFWRAYPKCRLWISVVAVLQVLSWLIVNLSSLGSDAAFDVRIGYFIWLLAFILLFAAHLVRKGTPGRSGGPELASSPSLGEQPEPR